MRRSDWCEQHTTLHANLKLYIFFIKKKKKNEEGKNWWWLAWESFLLFLRRDFININWMWRKFSHRSEKKFHESCFPPFPAPSSAGKFKQIIFSWGHSFLCSVQILRVGARLAESSVVSGIAHLVRMIGRRWFSNQIFPGYGICAVRTPIIMWSCGRLEKISEPNPL